MNNLKYLQFIFLHFACDVFIYKTVTWSEIVRQLMMIMALKLK